MWNTKGYYIILETILLLHMSTCYHQFLAFEQFLMNLAAWALGIYLC